MWANRSGCSPKMSNHERFAQVANQKKCKRKISWPPKKSVYELWNKNLLKKYFFIFFFCFSLKNNKRTNVVFGQYFWNALKKVNNCHKRPKWCFCRLIAFFSPFSKIQTKRALVRLLFLKLNQSQNMKKNFWEVFVQKPKTRFFGGPK